MRNSKITGSFDSSRRRRNKGPILLAAIAILIVLLLVFLWNRGGERPMERVEKAIPAERLGQ